MYGPTPDRICPVSSAQPIGFHCFTRSQNASGLVGQLLDQMSNGEKIAAPEQPANRSGYSAYEADRSDNEWITY